MAETVGFIGLGNIGNPMARRVLGAGFPLVGYDVRPEALERLVQAGAEPATSPKEVARRAPTNCLSLPAGPLATTASLCAVFVPVIFLSGLTGRLFREFGVVLMGVIAVSAFVALTLTPMMCRKLLSPRVGGSPHSCDTTTGRLRAAAGFAACCALP